MKRILKYSLTALTLITGFEACTVKKTELSSQLKDTTANELTYQDYNSPPAAAPLSEPKELERSSQGSEGLVKKATIASSRASSLNSSKMKMEAGELDCFRVRPDERNADVTYVPETNSEEYSTIVENQFQNSRAAPLSTFSIDVDGASYSNSRRFLKSGNLPPVDAVRIEEFINSFDYTYAEPTSSDPFSITTEVATTPWNPETKLVHIGLQGRHIDAEKLPPSNFVFLIDVSGSMSSEDKLPLLKSGLELLIDQLRAEDRLSIIVYAGSAGMVLPPTSGAHKEVMRNALSRLEAGGSTAGGAGLHLAYQVAQQSFLRNGNNRIILATDGDFNVGVSSDQELVHIIEEKRKTGVFLSVLGFGTGNYKDSKMEQLADKGNGNYFYIDNLSEARKVLVEKMSGTVYTLAKDVKIQVEFNPTLVKSYRLIGYENRILAARDFNDDKKDAGELGAGANVTALYELILSQTNAPSVDPLKYQRSAPRHAWNWGTKDSETSENEKGELLTVKFRYKEPTGTKSKLITKVLNNSSMDWKNASQNFRFSAAVAGFGLILRNSQFCGAYTLDQVFSLGQGAKGRDLSGHRAEFLTLVQSAKALIDNHARVSSLRPE